MSVCPKCRASNAAGARFCAVCATPLTAPHAAAAPFGYAAGVRGAPPPGYAPAAGFGGAAGYHQPAFVPTPEAPLELWLEGFVTFDGAVIEQFHFRQNFCGRRHVAVIGEISFHDKGDLTYLDLQTVFRSMNLLIPFRSQHRGQVDGLVGAIRAAQAARTL